ncbi:hypothetical protein CASFOL_027351 [Castilleja foliolosa]|uniref:Methyltransferase type 11 domain-containing protein n=1 Tax=Castilleja foliolosa TaxID=1961234 RepID=A0ABD3CEJ9_9LAMI
MGRKKQQTNQPQQNSSAGEKNQDELLKTLGDFTSKENWDQFFTIRGSDDSFEWYAEWPQLQSLLTDQLLSPSSALTGSDRDAPAAAQAAEVSILVPGCGNSKLSEHLYDAGFLDIMNVDFSKVVISDMLRRNVRERPGMKWRVMDMTSMQVIIMANAEARSQESVEREKSNVICASQFADETFDAIVDKGGLDALMEPELGSILGNQYLSEVKRLLKTGGKYICLTLVESHVLDLLFSKFRFGWKMSLYVIAKEPSSRNLKLQTFMVVVEKDISASVSEISSFMDEYSAESHGNQARELYTALERERKVRSEYSNVSDILYSLEDLNLGAKGNLSELEPGRRIKLILGEPGGSRFYNGVLLDAQQDSGPFSYHFAVFLVPKVRAGEWLFTSEEGQSLIVISSKAARLVIILLDSSNSNASMEYIQMDLSPLVKQLAPKQCDDGVQIPFLTASDGVKKRDIVHQVTSFLTGPIVVDEVIYEKLDDYDDDLKRKSESQDLVFRRLTFQRSHSLLQSEALLSTEGSDEISTEVKENKVKAALRTRRKGKQGQFDSHSSGTYASSGKRKVDHNYLASSYHNGIISGLLLLYVHLKGSNSSGGMVETVVIGLGAGLLPMFMKTCLPALKIEVVELDPVVLSVAKKYFGFEEDERLQVHIADGIHFVSKRADTEGQSSCKHDILIVDVDSSDSSSGLTCPAEDFVEESFLLSAKNSLSEEGLFVINLVTRSSTVKNAVYSSLKKVFGRNLFSLQLEEDVNEVIFALKNDSPITEDELSEACVKLERSLELQQQECKRIVNASKLIKPLPW